MSDRELVPLVKGLYEAFGRRDIEFILDGLTGDVEWSSNLDPVVPWAGMIQGKAGVPAFFEAMYEHLEVEAFEPKEWITEGAAVVSIGTFSFRARATGKRANSRWIFIWRFREGKVCSYEQFHDWALADAFRPNG